MKWLLICATLGLVCMLCAIGGAQPAANAAAAVSMYQAASMYQVEQVTGTLLSAQKMYDSGDSAWYSGQLKIERGTPALKAGTNCAIRFSVPNITLPEAVPGSGDQITAKLFREPDATRWEASEMPAVLGRGELIRPGDGAVADIGSPKAKILVKMLAPLATDCHQKTAQLLRDLAAREPDRIRVQLFDMRTVAGRQEMRKERLNCATVLVNNRYEFILDGPGGKRKVAFHHHPNDPKSSYNSEDVIAVIQQEIKRLYP